MTSPSKGASGAGCVSTETAAIAVSTSARVTVCPSADTCFATARMVSSAILASGNSALPANSVSGSRNTPHNQSAVCITSFARNLPSPSRSISLRLSSLISNPVVGQESTVHIFWSNSPKWRISSPDCIFTRVVPPTLAKVQLYFISIVSF